MSVFGTQAQDIHFSQFYNSPLNLNPALTGVFKGDLRFNGNYRNQWASVPVDYLSFSGAFDMKIMEGLLGKGLLSGGAIFNIDQAGDSRLSLSEFKLNAAYAYPVDELNAVSIGIQMGIGQRRFNADQLRFQNQFSGDIYDANLSSREDFSNTQRSLSDFSAGLNWHTQLDRMRTNVNAGISFMHLNRPEIGFLGAGDVRLASKYNGYAIAEIEVHPQVDWIAAGIFSLQGKYRETVINTGLRYHFPPRAGKKIAVQLGSGLRFGDAIIPNFEIFYNAWQFGFSYDINISDFEIATNRAGGPEMSLSYVITKVKPVKSFKACPIF